MMAFEGALVDTPTLKQRGDPMSDIDFQTFLERLDRFQQRIGYQFTDVNILIRALTSMSYCSATKNSVPGKGIMESQGDKLLKRAVDVWVSGYCNHLPVPHQAIIKDFLNSNIYLSRVGMNHMKIYRCVRVSREKYTSPASPGKYDAPRSFYNVIRPALCTASIWALL